MSEKRIQNVLVLSAAIAGVVAASADAATYTYTANGSGTASQWSTNTNWTPSAPAGGPDAAGDEAFLTNNITAGRSIALFNTGNAGDATKTVGRLDIGDADGSHAFSLTAGTLNGVLDFDKGGGATLNQVSGSAANSISAPITLSTGLTIGNASANNLTISGAITGSNAITVNSGGTGAVILSNGATSTYDGGVTLTAGVLLAGNSSTPASGIVTGGPLGTGTLTLNGGTFGSSGANRTLANAVTLGGDTTFGLSGGTTTTFSGVTTLTANRAITTNANATYSGTVTDGANSFALRKGGTATLTVTDAATSTFDGGLFIDAGTLNTSQNGNYAIGTGAITFAANTALAMSNTTITNPIVLDGATSINTATGGNLSNRLTGVVSGVGRLTANFNNGVPNNGNLSLTNTGNTFSGGLTINNNTSGGSAIANVRVIAGSSAALGSGIVTLGAGTTAAIGGVVANGSNNLNAGTSAADQDIDGLDSASATAFVIGNSSVIGGSTITVSPSTGSSAFAGVIGTGTVGATNGNNLKLIMNGAASTTQTLSGSNTYSGSTTVNGGTLLVNGANSGSGAFSVGDGAGTDTLGGTGSIAGTIAVNSVGGRLAPGNGGAGTGSLELGGTLNISGELAIDIAGTSFAFNGTENYDRLKVTGLTTLGGTLAVANTLPLAAGQVFGIVDAVGGRSGVFSNYAEGAVVATNGSYNLLLTYLGDVSDSAVSTSGGTDVVLYTVTVPEPTGLAVLFLGALQTLRRRRAA